MPMRKSHRNDGKYDEMIALLDEAKREIYGLASEWEVNDAVTDIYKRIDMLKARCGDGSHKFEYDIVPATCKTEGRSTAVCTVCGYSYVAEIYSAIGGEHMWDSGRQSTASTYKREGVITRTCLRCGDEIHSSVPKLTGGKEVDGGMLHVDFGYNYMSGSGTPYRTGDGTVEIDICPINTDMNGEGTSYAGVWFAGYSIVAAYNFRMQRFEIVTGTNLPYGTGGTANATNYTEWDDGVWHKFAVNIKGNTVSIYCDGKLMLSDTRPEYNSSNNIPLFYSVGEYYLDNFLIGSNGYNQSTGEGSAKSWDLDDASSQKSFERLWGFGGYTDTQFVKPTEATDCTATYIAHDHNGRKINTVMPGCSLPGYDEYECKICGEVYHDNFTEPHLDGHSFASRSITKKSTASEDGECVYRCLYCSLSYTTVIPAGTALPDEDMAGDVNGDNTLDAFDIIILLRYLAEYDEEFDKTKADIDKDGKVGVNDVTVMLKFMAEWVIDRPVSK